MTGSRYYRDAPPAAASAARSADWRHRALCRDQDPELFFPTAVAGTPRHAAEAAEARQVCRRCPVVADCLTYALTHRVEYGVWGGMGEDERKAVLRGRHPIRDPRLAEAVRTVRVDQAVRTDRIRALAAAGHNDTEIARALGGTWTPKKVGDARRAAGVPAGRVARSMQRRPEALDGAA